MTEVILMPLRARPHRNTVRVRRRLHPADTSPAHAEPAYIRAPYHRRRYTEVWLGEPLARIRVPTTASSSRHQG